MHKLAWWLAGSCAVLAIGCTGTADPTAPTGTASSPVGSSSLGGTVISDDLAMAASAIYRLQVDPNTLSASITLEATRGAQKNEDVYDLSVDAFMGPGNVKVEGVTSDGTNIDFNLLVSHPFAAPSNLDGPATAGNRADLGVSMRLLALLDAPPAGNTYFAGTDDVVANTGMIVNQDGYMDPGGMVTITGMTSTAFPFKNVVDEIADNRVGAPNGGSVTGNFDPNDGWTRASMGATRDQWTGYGVLHQGQSANVSVSVDLAALTANGFSLDVVPVVKYNDPRQGANSSAKRANRLPPATPDSARFGYRMPHGAFDIADISYLGESGGLVANNLSGTTVKFRVTDWDARATETTEALLSDDVVLSNVAVGESGVPTAVEAEIPSLNIAIEPLALADDDTSEGGDAGADSGLPGDELYYSATLSNITTSGQPTNGGTYTGMMRAVDIEANAAFNDTWHFALDENLTPLSSDIPEPIGYQSFTVDLGSNSLPPTFTSVTVPPQAGNGSTLTITVNGLADPESDPITVEVDWDDDGTYTVHGPYNSPYTNPLNITSPITYTFVGPAPDMRDLPIRIKDTGSTVPVTPTPTFEVSVCAADGFNPAPYPVSGFTPNTNSASPQYYNYLNFATVIGFGDYATLRFGQASPTKGVITFQNQQFQASVPSGYPNQIGDFVRAVPGGSSPYITNFGANLVDNQVHQIEVDSTNRVLFAHKISDMTHCAPINTVYAAGTGAAANIRYFDYTGAVVPFASLQTINTGANRVASMTLDQQDNVYMVDTTNVLHKYVKTSGYAEQMTGGFPMDLKTAPIGLTLTGSGAGEKKIHDFVIDWRTGSFFFLVQTMEPAGAPGNGYIYRLDCDGFHPLVLGNQNPYRYQLSTSTTQNLGADIIIDQLDWAASPITGNQASAQIITCSQSSGHDITLFGTNMVKLGGLDPTFAPTKLGMSVENYLYYAHTTTGYAMWYGTSTPPGWQ